MKLVPAPLAPIPTSTSAGLLPHPFGPEMIWRFPTTPLWEYKSQLPGSLPPDPRLWSREDVAAFIRWAEREYDLQPIDMDMFQMNGKALCLLTRTDLAERAPSSGDILYNVLQLVVREMNSLRMLPNSPITPTSRHPYPLSPHTPQPTTPNWSGMIPSDFHVSHAMAAHLVAQSNSVTLSPSPSVDSQSGGSPNHPDATSIGFGHSVFNANGAGGSSNGSNSNPSDSDEDDKYNESSKNGYMSSPPNTPSYMGITPMSFLTPRSPKHMDGLSSPGVYKRTEFFGNGADGAEPNTNGRLLWDFLQQLLNDPSQRYTGYIAWKNRETGVFKIVDPPGLAKLWGIQKNHLSMNYDKMSRALRYYYRVNILRKVQGERHCYQFLLKPSELKSVKNISLLRNQMSPTATKAPHKIPIMPQITIKPEPIDHHQQQISNKEHEAPLPAAVPSHIKLSEQVQKQSLAALAQQQSAANSDSKNDGRVRMDYQQQQPEDTPTDLSMDAPTDLSSSSSRHVNIVCSPDPPLGMGTH